jgi:tetratricopeptide (TPR) repeat protein
MAAVVAASPPDAHSPMASTAGATHKSAAGATANSTKFDVCIDALMKGCVNSFVQVYTLSHREPVCVDELAQTMFSIPDETLPWVLDQLTEAEMKRRHSDFRGVLDHNMSLATYFEERGDKAQAMHQQQLALQSCTESLDNGLEGEAHENIAGLYERLTMLPEALLHHETRLKLAEISGDAATKDRAARNNIRLYMGRGEKSLADGHLEEAKQFFEHAVEASRGCGESASEARAYSALGNITVLMGDIRKALEYQRRYLVVSREAKDGHGESRAALEVAKLQDKLGNAAEAISSLKEALAVAEETNDLLAINEACKHLGETYKNDDQNMKAVHYFQEHFRVSRDIGEAATADSARIQLGFALGHHHFEHAGNRRGYLNMVCDDLAAQLEWMGSGTL